MSVREFTPLFSWGFSLRRSLWLIPLFNNNIFSFGNSAVNGPYGRNRTVGKRYKSTTSTPQQREVHVQVGRKRRNTPDLSDLATDMKKVEEVLQQEKKQETKKPTVEEILLSQEKIKKELEEMKNEKKTKYSEMSDGQVLDLVLSGKLQHYKLEAELQDMERAVKIRRMYFAANIGQENAFKNLPYENFDYQKVYGVCCENVVGYVPLPVGVVANLKLDGETVHVPMATCEGCLIASTQRGAKALSVNGVNSIILADGMTRGPVIQMPNAKRSAALKLWLAENFESVAREFNSTSRFARLSDIKVAVAGRKAFLRFKCFTGDAMGMNMITKAVTKAMDYIKENFPDMEIISVSGNYCTDKKPSAVNWLEGRGKSVVCDAVVPKEVVEKQLKTTVDALVKLSTDKNLVGSAMAGSIGGMNAHASNIVTAIFLATGQDAAQNVESSNCITLMEKTKEGDLYISCTMPSIEVGTVGGGTHLNAQSSCLEIIGVKGPSQTKPGQNSQKLARVICATVMAGELSLMSALAAGSLVESHMRLNRKKE